MSERRYTEDEFARILRKATELQRRALPRGAGSEGEAGRSEAGLSLQEIRDIAGEVGIDPTLVERAADLVAADRVTVARPGAVRYVLTDSLPGRLSEEDKIRVLQAVRASSSHHGEAGMSGEGLEWSTAKGELTQFQVSVERSGAAVLVHLLPTMGGFLAAIATGASLEPESFLVGASLVAGGLTAGVTTARIIWRNVSRRTAERTKAILVGVRRTLAGHEPD